MLGMRDYGGAARMNCQRPGASGDSFSAAAPSRSTRIFLYVLPTGASMPWAISRFPRNREFSLCPLCLLLSVVVCLSSGIGSSLLS